MRGSGIMNIFKRLMNVVFIVWALWILFVIILRVSSGNVQIELSNIARYPLIYFNTFLGWLPILAVNYILNNKATVWNKGS